jgi:hypothetical protein
MTEHPPPFAGDPQQPAPQSPSGASGPAMTVPGVPLPLSQSQARRRRTRWLVAGGLGLVLVAAVVVTVVLLNRGPSDEARIQDVVDRFATAVENGDQATMLQAMCAEEAEDITDDDDYDPDIGAGSADRSTVHVEVAQVTVTGDTAKAQVSTEGRQPATLYFRKDADGWKVCASAGPAQ